MMFDKLSFGIEESVLGRENSPVTVIAFQINAHPPEAVENLNILEPIDLFRLNLTRLTGLIAQVRRVIPIPLIM
jgi:hypothetical protein